MVEITKKDFKRIIKLLHVLDNIFDDIIADTTLKNIAKRKTASAAKYELRQLLDKIENGDI